MPDPSGCPVDRDLPVDVSHLSYHVTTFSQPHHDAAALVETTTRAVLILQHHLHPLDVAAESRQGKLQPSLNVGNAGSRHPTTDLLE